MTSALLTRAVAERIDLIATEVGRLRRRVATDMPGTTTGFALERLARHVESLDLMLRPSAAEIAACAAPGNDDAVAQAIEVVDARSRELRRLLGEVPR